MIQPSLAGLATFVYWQPSTGFGKVPRSMLGYFQASLWDSSHPAISITGGICLIRQIRARFRNTRVMSKTPSEDRLERWVEEIRQGDSRAISRAISAVENRDAQAAELLKRLFPHTGRAAIIGVTGAPGSGKSTLVSALAALLRGQNRQVGILAVDPTSPYTGGAILGDRVRMQAQSTDPGTYIRSMATRGTLGGLSAATLDAAAVLDAAGKDFILI